VKDEQQYLQDMLEYLQAIEDFSVDGREYFLHDLKTQLAMIRAYEVIGEIVKRLPQSLRDSNPQINWKKLAGFRDFLAHNYTELILEFIWAAVEDLPNLRAAVAALLASLPDDDTP
jgi:uncharacterized protein with HEPN domain